MTTNNAVNTSLAGQTGTGNFVGATSPTISGATLSSPTMTTPTLGVAMATSLAFSPTTDGIIGTTAGTNASAGYVGQVISSVILIASAVSLSSTTPADITSISLTAGDWDLWGNVGFAQTNNATYVGGWINSTSATQPDPALSFQTFQSFAAGHLGFVVPGITVNVSTTTVYYLSVNSVFGSGSVSAFGGIYARRRR